MAYNADTISRFERISGFDIRKLLTDFVDFNRNDKPKIFSYYQGNSKISGNSFEKLENLRKGVKKAIRLFELNRSSFVYQDDWDLFMEVEDISRKLNTINKSNKYLRSSITTKFNANPLVQTNLKTNQTLENLAQDLSYQNPLNDWTQIFLDNNLTEESYTNQGGTLLSVNFNRSTSLTIESVVDNIDTPEKIYGIDILKDLKFENNDIKTLSYQDTLKQSIEILTSLNKGDVPEFTSSGIDKRAIIGSTYGSVALPVVFRQLYENFASDDSFNSFSIIDAEFIDDYITITFRIGTKANEFQEGFLKLN